MNKEDIISPFQVNCDRLFGSDNYIISPQIKKRIKEFYNINSPITLTTISGTRLNLDVLVKEFYLFNSLCITYNDKLKDGVSKTRQEVSLICLDIISRVLIYPKFYYTLMVYNLPDKVSIKDNILTELLIMFDISINDLVKDKFIYYELGGWKLRGYRSLFNMFKYVDYLDLIVFDSKEQIINSLKR